MVANGFERDKIAARFEGNNAMFLLLVAGWNPWFYDAMATPSPLLVRMHPKIRVDLALVRGIDVCP
jgi:hypothetical protein